MRQVVIENPIINTPFHEPTRHFRFSDEGITNSAETIEDMPEVIRYVKNHNLGFTIPYTLGGEEKNYIPDFIICIDDGHGPTNLLNLIVEVTGEKRKTRPPRSRRHAHSGYLPSITMAASGAERLSKSMIPGTPKRRFAPS